MKTAEAKAIAYIDGANLHKSIKSLGWNLDYLRFRVWLKDKYKIDTAYIFLGLVPRYKDIYKRLQEYGYVLVFKEVTYDGNGKVKGNCDADLVLEAVKDFYEGRVKKATLVSSDGDYARLVSFWKDRRVFRTLISPSPHCSFLLRKLNIPIVYIDKLRSKISAGDGKEKAPSGDETPQGSSS